MALPEWLSPLCLMDDFDGDWVKYEAEVFSRFQTLYVNFPFPLYEGKRVSISMTELHGKPFTYWHLISEGQVESDRTPDIRRCERIAWARDILNNAADPRIKIWDVIRGHGQERRTCLWCEDAEFLVILARRKSSSVLWTAYPVIDAHRKRKLQSQYEEFHGVKAETASD